MMHDDDAVISLDLPMAELSEDTKEKLGLVPNVLKA